MINSELNSNGLGNTGTAMPTFHKQPPIATKKAVLRDVQTINGSSVGNHPGMPFVEGRLLIDGKVAGAKRLNREYPSSHTCPPPLSNDCASWHPIYSRNKFESEAGKRRMPDKMDKYVDSPQSRQILHMLRGMTQKKAQIRGSNMTHCLPVTTPQHVSSMTSSSYSAPAAPISLGNPDNGLQTAESDCHRVTSEVAHLVDSKEAYDEQRKERFINLQNFLKQCDEPFKKVYIQSMLQHLSPAELSRHAIELEKRAIQLTIEEGNEMQRVKVLNIFGKSATAKCPLQTNKKLGSKQ